MADTDGALLRSHSPSFISLRGRRGVRVRGNLDNVGLHGFVEMIWLKNSVGGVAFEMTSHSLDPHPMEV